jgi:DNA-directed RNA polymerase subunit RPC12/RpoP
VSFGKSTCAECGAQLRSRVAGFVPARCPHCRSGRLVLVEREDNAPELPTEDDLSIAIDNKAESDKHRKRTVIGVDTGKVSAERLIALEERRRRWERRALWVGAVAGYAALVIELWRLGL